MTQIRNIELIRTIQDADGFHHVEAVPLSGDPIPLWLSAAAIQDMADIARTIQAQKPRSPGGPKRSPKKKAQK